MATAGAPPRDKSKRRSDRQIPRGPRRPAGPRGAGYDAREIAVSAISAVIESRKPLDDALADAVRLAPKKLEPRDTAFARAIIATVLRRHGEIDTVLKTFLTRPLPQRRGNLWPILLAATAQLLMLDTPAHAAISTAVDQCHADEHARHFSGLANAVLRRVSTEGPAILANLDGVALNVPAWMLTRWTAFYGAELARRIAAASLQEAPLDISAKADAGAWAERLSGELLSTGSIRLMAGGRIEDLAGYAEGAWWVQDAAAALPARLLGAVDGLAIADLCSAPGGKTAELAAYGARVTAVELSPVRAERLKNNLARLALDASVVVADATSWQPPNQFDAVLLDAPCTSTGTLRRHPDILHLKRQSDVGQLAALQIRLLDAAAKLVKPGGQLVFCTCSLEPEEGLDQVRNFLARTPAFARVPLRAGEFGIDSAWLTPDGDLRTLPTHLSNENARLSGMDGFFAARLRRATSAA